MQVAAAIGITSATAIIGIVTIAAQNPPASSAQSTVAHEETAVIVTGCVEKADRPTTEGITAKAEEAFILTNVRFVTNEPIGTSGTTGAPVANSAMKYPLAGDPSRLTPHVGQRVEIAGMFQPNPNGFAPTLRVASVEIVAPSCDSQRGTNPQ